MKFKADYLLPYIILASYFPTVWGRICKDFQVVSFKNLNVPGIRRIRIRGRNLVSGSGKVRRIRLDPYQQHCYCVSSPKIPMYSYLRTYSSNCFDTRVQTYRCGLSSRVHLESPYGCYNTCIGTRYSTTVKGPSSEIKLVESGINR
jgi:hypothetical protein